MASKMTYNPEWSGLITHFKTVSYIFIPVISEIPLLHFNDQLSLFNGILFFYGYGFYNSVSL